MDAKEVVISTISEISNNLNNEKTIVADSNSVNESTNSNLDSNHIDVLIALRERTLVLFEGLRKEKEENIQTKLNMVLSYLEYQLCLIEDAINKSKN